VAPLRAAADALRLDTTNLSLEQQADRVVALAREHHLG
jgi:cytidylate kinase